MFYEAIENDKYIKITQPFRRLKCTSCNRLWSTVYKDRDKCECGHKGKELKK